MSLPIGSGRPYLQVLTSGGTLVKRVFLPPPDKDYPELEWIKKFHSEWELLDGGQRERVKGYLPKLTLKWKTYPDVDGNGLTLGSDDGNLARITDLMVLLATPSGQLRVCPGPNKSGTDVGFVALVKKIPNWKLKGRDLAQNVEIQFLGRDILSTPVLPVIP